MVSLNKKIGCNISKEKADFIKDYDKHTDDPEFNRLSQQHTFAHIWLKHVRKCKCKLDETTDECKHITKALNKLYGKQVDKMWNDNLRKNFTKFAEATGFKIPYKFQKNLSS